MSIKKGVLAALAGAGSLYLLPLAIDAYKRYNDGMSSVKRFYNGLTCDPQDVVYMGYEIGGHSAEITFAKQNPNLVHVDVDGVHILLDIDPLTGVVSVRKLNALQRNIVSSIICSQVASGSVMKIMSPDNIEEGDAPAVVSKLFREPDHGDA